MELGSRCSGENMSRIRGEDNNDRMPIMTCAELQHATLIDAGPQVLPLQRHLTRYLRRIYVYSTISRAFTEQIKSVSHVAVFGLGRRWCRAEQSIQLHHKLAMDGHILCRGPSCSIIIRGANNLARRIALIVVNPGNRDNIALRHGTVMSDASSGFI